jgi:glutaredoxin-related protein
MLFVVIFIFIAQIYVLAGSVALSRVSVLSEHHPWLFINCLGNKNWRSHFKLNNKFNWKTIPFIFLNPMDVL